MPNLKWFPAVLLSLAGVVSPAQQLETKPADPAAAFRDEAYVVEQLRTVVRFENDGSEHREQTARVRVQSDAGVQRLSQLVFGYSSATERMEMACMSAAVASTTEPSGRRTRTYAISICSLAEL